MTPDMVKMYRDDWKYRLRATEIPGDRKILEDRIAICNLALRALGETVPTEELPQEQREPDGHAVLLEDKVSSKWGFWFVGIWNTKQSAELILTKSKAHEKVSIAPMFFAPSSTTPLTAPRQVCSLCVACSCKAVPSPLERHEEPKA